MIKILAVTSNPEQLEWLRLDREIDAIRTRLADHSGFDFNIALAVRANTLITRLRNYKPDILHFSGHGMKSGLFFETPESGSAILNSEVLSGFLKHLHLDIKCIFLNACYSAEHASPLAETVDFVIGMNDKIDDEVAAEFSITFYDQIGAGSSIGDAFNLAKQQLALISPTSANIPKLLAERTDPSDVYLSARAVICAEFVMDNEGHPICENGHYQVNIWISGAPPNTVSVTYQLHSTFKKRFHEVLLGGEDNDDLLYAIDIWTYGDFTVKATLWNLNGGTGVSGRLSGALKRKHAGITTIEISEALQSITDN